MDMNRPCTAECMAYESPPSGADYQDKQWAACLLLVNAHRAGKHLVVLTEVVHNFTRKMINAEADRHRAGQPSPPTPR